MNPTNPTNSNENEHDTLELESGEVARFHEKKTFKERLHIRKATFLKALICVIGGVAAFIIFTKMVQNSVHEPIDLFGPTFLMIASLAFLFELLDSSTGMGFGTSLSPILLLLGYDPLTVVPVLLVSESISGLTAGWFHHEFENYKLSFSPMNRITKSTLIISGAGALGIIISVVLTYLAFEAPKKTIETYVSIIILSMAVISFIQAKLRTRKNFNPTRLTLFALLAGANKGVGGGGFGPVATLGALISGVYTKSAVAIVSLAEGFVSVIGVIAFWSISIAGVAANLTLLPAIFFGSFMGGILSPYIVRIIPNWVWEYVLPAYAIVIGVMSLIKIYFK